MIDRNKIIEMATGAVSKCVPSQKFIDEVVMGINNPLKIVHPEFVTEFEKMTDEQRIQYLLKLTAESMLMAYTAAWENVIEKKE